MDTGFGCKIGRLYSRIIVLITKEIVLTLSNCSFTSIARDSEPVLRLMAVTTSIRKEYGIIATFPFGKKVLQISKASVCRGSFSKRDAMITELSMVNLFTLPFLVVEQFLQQQEYHST